MGAYDFVVISYGKDVESAFFDAVDQAAYLHGHGGYTGTIAEKTDWVVIGDLAGEHVDKSRALDHARLLMERNDARIDDKWGPAGAIRFIDEERPGYQGWVFFGYASS